MFPTSSDWDAALGSPGGCEMQGLCQGSDPWAMGAWRWDERCFQRNKKMEKPPPVQWELWAGCCTPSTNGHGHQAGPGWAPAVSSSELQGHRDMGTLVGLPSSLLVIYCCAPGQGCALHTSGELRCWVGVAAPRSCAIPRAPGCVRGDFGPRAFPLPQQSGFPPPAKGAVWEALAAGFGNPSPEPVRLCPLLLSCQDLPGCSRLATRPPDLLGD